MTTECLQEFTTCLYSGCAAADFTTASTFMSGYCAGQGIVRSIDGILVTIVPPVVASTSLVSETQQVEPTTVIVTQYPTESSSELPTTTPELSNTLLSTSSASVSTTTVSTTFTNPLQTPAAISVYVIIAIIFFVCAAFYVRYWRRKRQGDFILPTHRSTRGKSFLIDGEPFKNLYKPDAIELSDKSQSTVGDSSFKMKIEDRLLPIVPIPTKNSPVASSSLPTLVTATTHPAPRNYVALPGQGSSSPSSMSPTEVTTPPGLEGSAVSQTFAAGLERARNVLGHNRDGSPVSPSSSFSSSTPSPSSGTIKLNTSIYAAASRAPLPAYSYQPAAPSPLRTHVGPSRAYNTIIEEPRTPHQTTPHSSAAAPPVPTISVFQMHSTVSTAQRGRPSYASHVRNPHSTENLRSFTFPQRHSLNDTELQITVSDALRDDGVPVERERSETPSGSMHHGAGGSVSSVKGRIQALVGGIRKDRE
ncbi:hypothetical protein RhiJN_25445 [Ceratobasidium sp. AG-Ba]|nr:hypothetical protein RhiJN_25445 [Ceratobasidium sp. AG-Ba]